MGYDFGIEYDKVSYNPYHGECNQLLSGDAANDQLWLRIAANDVWSSMIGVMEIARACLVDLHAYS